MGFYLSENLEINSISSFFPSIIVIVSFFFVKTLGTLIQTEQINSGGKPNSANDIHLPIKSSLVVLLMICAVW